MAKLVLYHFDWCEPKPFAVLAEHEDGTVDIGPEGGEPFVTRCKVCDSPTIGHVTLVAEPDVKQPEDPAIDPVEADAAKKAAEKKALLDRLAAGRAKAAAAKAAAAKAAAKADPEKTEPQ